MKTTLVFVLLVLVSLYTVCAELAETSTVLSSSQTRKLKDSSGDSEAGFWEFADSKTCIPVPYIDFLYSRKAPIYKTIVNVTGPPNCLGLCSFEKECVAFNYDPYQYKCELLKSPGTMLPNSRSITALFAFVNDDACDSANFIPEYHRPGHDYAIKTGIATAKDCCKMCLKDSPKCVAWDYCLVHKVCYLKNMVSVLKRYPSPKSLVCGFGGYYSPKFTT